MLTYSQYLERFTRYHQHFPRKVILLGYEVIARRYKDRIVFKLYDDVLAVLTPDDTYTLYKPKNVPFWWSTTKRYAMIMSGVEVRAMKSRYRTAKNPMRVVLKWQRATVPFVDGIQIRHGEVVNPEKCVDYFRTLDKKKAAKARKELADIGKIVRSLARLDVPVKLESDPNDLDTIAKKREYLKPTTELAERLLSYGAVHLLGPWRFRHGDATVLKKKAADRVMVALKETVYRKKKLYSYKPKERHAAQ